MTIILRLLISALLLSLPALVAAPTAQAQQIKVHNTYGSPIDTLKNTHFKTDVPEAKDFVKETSPDRGTLNYTPLTGVDPQRPKPRDPKGVEALQAELDQAGARNVQRARGLLPTHAKTTRKRKAAETVVGAAAAR